MAEVVHMIDSEVFLAFSTYATIVILKMMLVSFMTTSCRLRRKPKDFVTHADTKFMMTEDDQKTMQHMDPDAERSPSGRQSDLENIISFVVIGLLYALTGPDLYIARVHFRVFVGAQIVHAAACLTSLPRPVRTLAFSAAVLTTLSMALRIISITFYL